METIKNYLDTMFARFPDTAEMRRLKNDLLSSMEDKFGELIAAGRTENEAIGVVISEFGNIEELAQEMNVESTTAPAAQPAERQLTREEADSFLADKRRAGLYIALGVVLCILGVALLILTNTFTGDEWKMTNFVSLATLFIPVAIAVGLFIYTGQKMEKYEFIEKGRFEMPIHLVNAVQTKKEAYQSSKTPMTIVSIILFILSPMVFIGVAALGRASEELYGSVGLAAMLCIVAVGVYLIIYTGTITNGFNALLKEQEYTPQAKKAEKVVGAVASVVWPLVTIGYLVWSFTTGNWNITWIVWPIAGVLFGGFAAICNAINGVED